MKIVALISLCPKRIIVNHNRETALAGSTVAPRQCMNSTEDPIHTSAYLEETSRLAVTSSSSGLR